MGVVRDYDAGDKPAGTGNDGYSGPTYRDATALAADLERLCGRVIYFELGPSDPMARYSRAGLWVRCVARDKCNPWCDAYAGGAQMGGARGARTLPGAMVAALYVLWERLEADGKTSLIEPS